jgi:hypothetical protein
VVSWYHTSGVSLYLFSLHVGAWVFFKKKLTLNNIGEVDSSPWPGRELYGSTAVSARREERPQLGRSRGRARWNASQPRRPAQYVAERGALGLREGALGPASVSPRQGQFRRARHLCCHSSCAPFAAGELPLRLPLPPPAPPHARDCVVASSPHIEGAACGYVYREKRTMLHIAELRAES